MLSDEWTRYRIPLSDICIQEGFLTEEAEEDIFRIREEKLASDRDTLFRKLVIKSAFASNQDVKRAADIQAAVGWPDEE